MMLCVSTGGRLCRDSGSRSKSWLVGFSEDLDHLVGARSQ